MHEGIVRISQVYKGQAGLAFCLWAGPDSVLLFCPPVLPFNALQFTVSPRRRGGETVVVPEAVGSVPIGRAAADDPLAAESGLPVVLDQDGFHGPGFGVEADLDQRRCRFFRPICTLCRQHLNNRG